MMKKVLAAIFALVIWMFIPLSLLSSVTDCGPTCSEDKWGYATHTFDNHSLGQTLLKTPKGISYDPSGLPISPQLIDRLTDEVEACLQKNYGTAPLPQATASAAYCVAQTKPVVIDRSSFVVKVVNDWLPSCDKSQQLLPNLVNPTSCLAKGLTPIADCPCRWRAGIKCSNILIVTPSFYLYKDVLIRFSATCMDPWNDPVLSVCATPSTAPNSDGTGP